MNWTIIDSLQKACRGIVLYLTSCLTDKGLAKFTSGLKATLGHPPNNIERVQHWLRQVIWCCINFWLAFDYFGMAGIIDLSAWRSYIIRIHPDRADKNERNRYFPLTPHATLRSNCTDAVKASHRAIFIRGQWPRRKTKHPTSWYLSPREADEFDVSPIIFSIGWSLFSLW